MTPLQALERLTKIHTHNEFKECYDIIETALKEHENLPKVLAQVNKQLEALEIMKDKMEISTLTNAKETIYYLYANQQITKEKYDLLKEVLFNDNN